MIRAPHHLNLQNIKPITETQLNSPNKINPSINTKEQNNSINQTIQTKLI
jgi:hypothetical protein